MNLLPPVVRTIAVGCLVTAGACLSGAQPAAVTPQQEAEPVAPQATAGGPEKTPEEHTAPGQSHRDGDCLHTVAGAATGAPSQKDAEHTAQCWLLALRAKDEAALVKATLFPFVLREPAEYSNCEDVTATTAASLRGVLSCMLDSSLFMETLRANPEPAVDAIPWSEPRGWLPALEDLSTPDALPVSIELPADGVYYELILIVKKGGVAGLWRLEEFDPT